MTLSHLEHPFILRRANHRLSLAFMRWVLLALVIAGCGESGVAGGGDGAGSSGGMTGAAGSTGTAGAQASGGTTGTGGTGAAVDAGQEAMPVNCNVAVSAITGQATGTQIECVNVGGTGTIAMQVAASGYISQGALTPGGNWTLSGFSIKADGIGACAAQFTYAGPQKAGASCNPSMVLSLTVPPL